MKFSITHESLKTILIDIDKTNTIKQLKLEVEKLTTEIKFDYYVVMTQCPSANSIYDKLCTISNLPKVWQKFYKDKNLIEIEVATVFRTM